MESIMTQTGSCGRFHITQVSLVCFVRFASVWPAFMMILGNYNPGWMCPSWRQSSSSNSTTNLTSEFSDRLAKYSISTTIQTSNVLDDSRGYSNLTTSNVIANISNDVISDVYDGTCDVIESCDGHVDFNPESITIISEFELVCDREWIATAVLVVANVGFVIGAAIIGYVCERFGRKSGLYGSTVLAAVSSGAAIFSPNWQTYACFAFLMNMASHGMLISSFMLVMEFLDSKWRGLTTSRPIVSSSLCLFCVTMTALKDWRHLHMATCVLTLLASCGYFLVEESPRWLFVHSENSKGERIIQKMAKRNGKEPIEMDTIDNLIKSFEKDTNEQKQSYSYFDLLRVSREYKVLILKTSVNLSFNVMIYRGLSFGLKSVPGNFYHNIIVSSVLQTCVVLTAGPISNLTGRRLAGSLYSAIGSTSCFVIVMVSSFLAEGYTQQIVIQLSAYMAKAATHTAIGTNLLLTAELFPTSIRSVAMGFSNTVCGIGAILCAFLIPRDNDKVSFAVCYSVMAACFVINIFMFSSLPETNKADLKDSLTIRRDTDDVCLGELIVDADSQNTDKPNV